MFQAIIASLGSVLCRETLSSIGRAILKWVSIRAFKRAILDFGEDMVAEALNDDKMTDRSSEGIKKYLYKKKRRHKREVDNRFDMILYKD